MGDLIIIEPLSIQVYWGKETPINLLNKPQKQLSRYSMTASIELLDSIYIDKRYKAGDEVGIIFPDDVIRECRIVSMQFGSRCKKGSLIQTSLDVEVLPEFILGVNQNG